jgi:hypothetical protein
MWWTPVSRRRRSISIDLLEVINVGGRADLVAIEHLKLKSVSKAAAWQRTGRAGREVGFVDRRN